ncbi:MAG: hypothetical protein ACTHLR_10400 [Rhizomicrobium sp.]
MDNKPPVVTPPPVGTPAVPRETTLRPVVPPRPRKPVARDVHEDRDLHMEDKEHADKTAEIDPKSLLGLDPGGVQKRLGAPARVENNALSHKWTYAASGCSFSIFFYPNVNSTSFRALKYGSNKDDGEATDSTDACVRRLLTARSNAGN